MAPKPYQTEIRVSFVHFAENEIEAVIQANTIQALFNKLVVSLDNVALSRLAHTTTEQPDV